MEPLYKWRVVCQTHGNVYVWSEIQPTTCPTNTADTIDSADTTIVETRDRNLVEIKEETTPTGGNFACETRSITANANETSTSIHTWPYPISVLEVYFVSTADNTGDEIELIIGQNTTIGVITAAANSGNTTLTVSQTVIDYLYKGYYIRITDGTHTEDLGCVTAIDTVSKIITVQTALVNNYSASTPTYIQMTVKPIRNYIIGNPWMYSIGDSKIGGSYIPTGTTISVVYKNNSNTTKNLVTNIEFLY